ncbi:MAG: ABC transporter ATP-binding protein, partial [Clostridiales bacterium]|nr:ABC transporter ATP-binding protein [Clostridiales bacterium]
KLNQKGITVVMVCHDMEVVLDFADRVMVMHEGQMRADNRTKTIFSDNEVLQEASLLPPQIAGVSLELGSGWNHIFDTSQMVKAVLSVRQSKGGKA